MPSGLIPGHKQSVGLFLERVYGIETQELFYKLLEEAFLPDLRAATMLDRVSLLYTFLSNYLLSFKYETGKSRKWRNFLQEELNHFMIIK